MNAIFRRSISYIAAVGIAALASPVPADQITLLSIQSGHSALLKAEGLTRVAVGDGRIAGAVPIGTSQVVINGKAPGHTTIFIWAGGTRQTYEVTVTAQELDDVAQMLRSAIFAPGIQVVSFDHSIVVRGTVGDGAQFQQINDIVSRFQPVLKEQDAVLVNAVTIQTFPEQAIFGSIPTVRATSSSAATRPTPSRRKPFSIARAVSRGRTSRATVSSSIG
jgi:Flp pilus assembly secretin CpaC